MQAKRLSILFACLMVVSASAAIVFDTWLQDDLAAEALFCKVFLCANDLVLEEAYRRLWSADPQEATSALPIFQEVVVRNPASPHRWSDLGDALQQQDEVEKARYCYRQAVDLGPSSPAVLLRAANFHLSLGERNQALPLLERILRQTRAYDEVVFSLFERMRIPVSAALASALPREQDAAQSYFRYLLRQGSPTGAIETWPWLVDHSLAGDTLLSQYIDFLLAQGEYEAAREAHLAYFNNRPDDPHTERQLISNPGFESELGETALDWRVRTVPHAEVSRDPTMARSSFWSLRIEFDGEDNPAYSHVMQKAVVHPGRLHFRAYLRLQGITTDQGLRFRIRDAEDPARLDVRTRQLVGTTDWTTIEASFSVSHATRLLVIQVERRPSNKIDNKIAGTVWIDDVSLASH